MKTSRLIWLMFAALLLVALVLASGVYTLGNTAVQGLLPIL